MTSTDEITWSWEYLPFTSSAAAGGDREIPNYRINGDPDMEGYIAETDENLPDDVQFAHALLISAAPEMFRALEYFFNIMHDYPSSRRKGYVKYAMSLARSAILKATGREHA